MNYAVKFEDIVLEELRKLCGDETAGKVMDTYRPVMRFLQDDHDSAKVQAERYYREYNAGTSAENWLRHIRKTREKYGRLEISAIESKPAIRNIPPHRRRSKDGKTLRVSAYGRAVEKRPNTNVGSEPRVSLGKGEVAASRNDKKIKIFVDQEVVVVSKGAAIPFNGMRKSNQGQKISGALATNGQWKRRDINTGRFLDVKGNNIESKHQSAPKMTRGKRQSTD